MERLTERKWKSKKEFDLKPCPCCGTDAVYHTEGDKGWVECPNCRLTTGQRQLMTIAVGVWNRRPTDKSTP